MQALMTTLLPLIGLVFVAVVLWRGRRKNGRPKPKDWHPSNDVAVTGAAASRATDGPDGVSSLAFVDAYEGGFIENAAEPVPVSAYVEITYRDASGNVSRRRIRTREFDRANANGYLSAFCELRGAPRTFRMDRVLRAVDAETGEVIASLHEDLRVRYEASPERAVDRALDESDLELSVLMFIARADGAFRKAEKDLVLDFLRSRTGDERVEDAVLEKQLANYGKGSVHTFKRDVGKLKALPEDRREALHGLAARLIATQKTVHPAEQEAVSYLAKRLEVPAAAAVSSGT
jgi:hypothetical protein